MKKLKASIIILMLNLCAFSQTVTKDSLMAMPIPMMRLICQDLIKLDHMIEQGEMKDEYIGIQDEIIKKQRDQITLHIQKDRNLNMLIDNCQNNFNAAENKNRKLKKEIKIYKATIIAMTIITLITQLR